MMGAEKGEEIGDKWSANRDGSEEGKDNGRRICKG